MPRIDHLFRSSDVQIGEFWCPPGDPLWRQENSIGAGWHVVFPGTGVLITHARGRPIVSNPNHAVFYDDGQTYRRELLADEGDHCVFMIATADLVREIYGALGSPDQGECERPRFASTSGPIHAGSYLLHRRLVAHLRGGIADDVAVREAAYALLLRSVGDGLRACETGGRAAGPARRRRTDEEHRRLAADAMKLISRRFTSALTLDGIAAELHVSPFHLARVFRSRTGWSIHRYLADLRLRTSLARLIGYPGGLARVATDLGFSSHAHFTDSFRRRFGVTPSAVRRPLTRPEVAELRRNLEASPAPRP